MAELVTTYHDLPLGAVDTSVLTAAERTSDYDIATLDRRHFTILRPAGRHNLTLHPSPETPHELRGLVAPPARIPADPHRTLRERIVGPDGASTT